MNKLFTLSILFAAMTIVACNKKKEGCTDPEAENYNSTAEVDDESCIYAATAPCGEGINYCFEYNGVTKSGTAILTKQNIEWYIDWDGDTTISEYAGMIFSGDTAGVYYRDTVDANDVHFFFHDTQAGYSPAKEGNMTISVFDTINGLEGTFEFELQDGTSITNGHIYKLAK